MTTIVGNCDKCGQPVPQDNDAPYIEFCATNDSYFLTVKPRHFLPTESCEGSPSRAQYIQGQPRDKRGYEYDPKFERIYRDALTKARRKAQNQ